MQIFSAIVFSNCRLQLIRVRNRKSALIPAHLTVSLNWELSAMRDFLRYDVVALSIMTVVFLSLAYIILRLVIKQK